MGIPIGSTLLYQGDGETTCAVTDGRKVNFEGRTLLLSKLTAELRQDPDRAIRGPAHWSYDGRLLNDLYEETHGDD